MTGLRIGYDLDGVGYVFGESVRQSMALDGIHVPPASDDFCKHWDFYEFWGMSRDDFEGHCDLGVDRGIVFGPGEGLTRPNFFESLVRTKAMGHKNIIVTHRYQGGPGMAQRNTYKWLEPYADFIDEVHFNADKRVGNCDMFVEDNLRNYDMLVAAGVDTFLVNRPWNGPYGDHRNRISDVSDYADAVEERTNFSSVV